jgi:predicted DNA-binding WGR domain protein
MKRRFEYYDANSAKFWEYEIIAQPTRSYDVVYSWGKMGNEPQSIIKRFYSLKSAEHAGETKANEKVKKGYYEILYT